MRVLHAGWGFRPWRGGGLISYAEDVMEAQAARGDAVAYFFAGRHYPLPGGPRLHRWHRRGVQMLEVLNSPIPVGIDQGTRFPDLDLHEPALERLFDETVADFRPDLVNLQELLGLPSSIVDLAHARGVPVVLTLHDYFPLCPTVKLFDADGRVCLRRDPAPECVRCCRDAPLGTRHLREMTTAFELGRAGRALPWAREPARRALGAVLPRMPSGLPIDRRAQATGEPAAPEAAYRRRRTANLELLGRIDLLVGASSRITAIYNQLGVPLDRLRTMHLAAGHISRLTYRPLATVAPPLRFATLAGAQNPEKGAFVLLDAAQRLAAEQPAGAYTLDVHGLVDARVRDELERLPSVRLRREYRPDELDSILDGVHVGIVPSTWEDVYPHAGLELIAKGIPVIGSARGGIPDYTVPGETGWLNESCTGEELAAIMAGLVRDPAEVVALNRFIGAHRDELIKTLDRQLDELGELYREVIDRSRDERAQPSSARL